MKFSLNYTKKTAIIIALGIIILLALTSFLITQHNTKKTIEQLQQKCEQQFGEENYIIGACTCEQFTIGKCFCCQEKPRPSFKNFQETVNVTL